MNKLVPLLAFSILLLVPAGVQQAYALNCESQQTGFWDQSSTWSNCGGGVPENFDTATINGGDTVTVRTTEPLLLFNLVVNPNGNLVVDGAAGGHLRLILSCSLTNSGNIDLFNGVSSSRGDLSLEGECTGTNECSGTITTHGGADDDNARLRVEGTSQFTNKGTINLNGGSGDGSGILGVSSFSTLDNHGAINENPGSGAFSGVVLVSGATFNDNLPNQCEAIGGTLIPIETTSLILAGAQTFSWMIPVTLSVLGIGLFVVTRKVE